MDFEAKRIELTDLAPLQRPDDACIRCGVGPERRRRANGFGSPVWICGACGAPAPAGPERE